jgi:uncharacterized membrane protein
MNQTRRKFNLVGATMNLAPLLDAPLAIQIHVAAVVPAALLGPYMFWARKGTPLHRLLGRVWLGLMVVAALSSFFIQTINLFLGFSPIHILSAYVLFGSWSAIRAARAGRIRKHRLNVIGLYVGGILVAGGFTLLPGRVMHEVFFSWPAYPPDGAGLFFFAAIMAGLVTLLGFLSALSGRAGIYPWRRPARTIPQSGAD